MTISAARSERQSVGLLALVSIGILLATLMLGGRVSRVAAAGDSASACLRPIDVVIIIDRSASMATDQGAHTRLGWAQMAASNFVDALDANGGVGGASGPHHVGLTSFGGNGDGSDVGVDVALGDSSAGALDTAISNLSASGYTPLKQGMAAGLGDMSANGRSDVDGVAVTHAFILLSDGRPYPDPANRPDAGEVGDYLSAVDQAFGIAIGEGGVGPNNPDLVLMNDLSKPAGDPSANFYHVLDAGDLPDIFSAIAEQLLCGDIQIEKIPDPAGPVDPGTVVTYTYNVWNEGDTPLSGVTVEDDTCSPVVYVSGKSGNNLLEKGEIWTYACSMPLQQSTKNEACAEGNFIGGGQASACVDVTVEVKEPASSTPTPEGSVEAGTGTPSESIGDAAVNVPGSSVLPTIVFSFVLVTSLGTLARASVRAQRRRS